MMRMRLGAFGLCALFALTGCGGAEHEDIKQWMAESSRDLKGQVPPLPELKPFPVAPYDAQEYPDPFSDRRVEAEKKEAVGVNQPDFNRPREQLESFPLESIQFVGVVSKKAKKHALVRVDGALYQVAIGNHMGLDYGRVVAISDNEVKLVETVQDPSGQTAAWVEREQALLMQGGGAGQGGR